MRKPVRVPIALAAMEGIMRRRPDAVGDSRRTAWKKRGMLKRTALITMAPSALPIMREPRGLLIMRERGMTGWGA